MVYQPLQVIALSTRLGGQNLRRWVILHLHVYPTYDTKRRLIMRFQSWSFEECGVLLHCHYFQLHYYPVFLCLLRSPTAYEAPFSIATTPKCRVGAAPFSELLHFTLDTYLIIWVLSKEHQEPFSSLWYDSTWDWTPVSPANTLPIRLMGRSSSTETDINTWLAKHEQLSIGYRSYESQTWLIK